MSTHQKATMGPLMSSFVWVKIPMFI